MFIINSHGHYFNAMTYMVIYDYNRHILLEGGKVEGIYLVRELFILHTWLDCLISGFTGQILYIYLQSINRIILLIIMYLYSNDKISSVSQRRKI